MIPELRRRLALESIEQFEFFRSVQWLDQVDSTNRHLDRQIKAGQVLLPCIAVADEQSAGVGRGANRWFSPQGCLMFSMAIEHTMLDLANTPDRLAMLPLRVGLALAQSLEPLVRSQPKVKWPNDVVVEDRKISGILIESQTVGSQTVGSQTVGSMGYAIIGIGIVPYGLKIISQTPHLVRRTDLGRLLTRVFGTDSRLQIFHLFQRHIPSALQFLCHQPIYRIRSFVLACSSVGTILCGLKIAAQGFEHLPAGFGLLLSRYHRRLNRRRLNYP